MVVRACVRACGGAFGPRPRDWGSIDLVSPSSPFLRRTCLACARTRYNTTPSTATIPFMLVPAVTTTPRARTAAATTNDLAVAAAAAADVDHHDVALLARIATVLYTLSPTARVSRPYPPLYAIYIYIYTHT